MVTNAPPYSTCHPTNSKRGFTLIELMIVVAILSVLAMIAVPKFGDLVRRAKEAAVKGHLGSLRSALSLYYANTEGVHPTSLSILTIR